MQFKSNAGADFSGRYTPKPHWLSGDKWPQHIIDRLTRQTRDPFNFNRIPLIKGDWHKRISLDLETFGMRPQFPEGMQRAFDVNWGEERVMGLDVGINFPTKKDIIDRAARRISEHHEDALMYSMYGVKPQPSRLYRPEKRRYRKSWLKLLYGMFRPRARYTMLAPIICAFLAVAGVSFVAGMLTTILLSL